MSNNEKDSEDSGKKIIEEIHETNVKKELSPEEQQQVAKMLENLQSLIFELKDECESNIPFSILHEKTGLDYPIIKTCILQLIMSNNILGFINDNGTSEDLSDDILIIRDKRFIDEMEPDYRTG